VLPGAPARASAVADAGAAPQARHPAAAIPPVPELGTLDLRQVLDAPYFFS